MTNQTDTDPFYFRQLLSGRDFAIDDPLASQMVNYAYLIGDKLTHQCLLVDPAYAVEDLVRIAQEDNMTITGVLASHYHPDHVGGSMMGHTIEGVAALLERHQVPVHVNANEAPWVLRTTGISESDLCTHSGGDKILVGSVEVTMVHTPGHTPGSQCFLAHGCLFSGDTLFLEGCGRTDLPGSDPSMMYDSLNVLAQLPDATVVFPGHAYSTPTEMLLSDVKSMNYVFKPKTREDWMAWFGGAG